MSQVSGWYTLRNEAPNMPTELLVYGTIGADDFTADALIRQLQAMQGRPLTVRINSPGGSVFDSLAVYNALRSRTASTTVIVEGLAASGASLIAMAGRPIRMHQSSFLMIHDASGLVVGGAKDMRETAELLDQLRDSMANIYAGRTGKPLDTIKAMMQAETWLNADGAKAEGFCDEVIRDSATAAAAGRFDLKSFNKVPGMVWNHFSATPNQPNPADRTAELLEKTALGQETLAARQQDRPERLRELLAKSAIGRTVLENPSK